MELITISKDLFSKLTYNIGAIPKNPVLPIMEDFLFEVKGDILTITSTNLEITVVTQIQVNNAGKKDGEIAIPSKILFETLKSLGDIPVTMDFDKDMQLKITTLNGNYKIPCDAPGDFPKMSDEKHEHEATVNSKQLRSGISKAMVATSTDALRLALNGVYFEFSNESVTMVGTDAYRLVQHISTCEFDGEKTGVIVPRTALVILKHLININDEFDVKISFTASNIKFVVNDSIVYCKLIDAKYPVYQAIMRPDSDIITEVDKNELFSSLKRVALYSDKFTNEISFDISPDKIKVYGMDLGMSSEATEEIKYETTGLGNEIGNICLNNKFLREMLDVLDNDYINIGLKDSASPCQIVEESETERTTLLLMPIRK